MKNTNWSTPKRNLFSGILDLRKALASGYNARLIRDYNENCKYPLSVKNENADFRCYEFSNSHLSTRSEIINDSSLSDFQKSLSLTYKTCYGTQEAVDTYYKTGKLSTDNLKGMGRGHLVKISDMVDLLKQINDERVDIFRKQYITLETAENKHFYDFFKLNKHNSHWNVRKFKRKLWVVELLKNDVNVKVPFIIKALNVILYPLKFIPKKRTLKMKEYKEITFSIGDVTNGYSIKIQIPKKFNF